MDVVNDAESQNEDQDRGNCISKLFYSYLRISAKTAGECLKPILLPYSSSKLYPSYMRAD